MLLNAETRAEREITLKIPLTDQKKWSIHDGSGNIALATVGTPPAPTSNTATPRYIEYLPALTELASGCTSSNHPLPIIHITNYDPQSEPHTKSGSAIRLPQDATESIYVVNQYGSPANIEYISARPLIEGGHAIDVPLYRLPSLPSKDKKPYLYLLTPVTVVMDAAIGVVFLYAWANGGNANQNQAPMRTMSNISISK